MVTSLMLEMFHIFKIPLRNELCLAWLKNQKAESTSGFTSMSDEALSCDPVYISCLLDVNSLRAGQMDWIISQSFHLYKVIV